VSVGRKKANCLAFGRDEKGIFLERKIHRPSGRIPLLPQRTERASTESVSSFLFAVYFKITTIFLGEKRDL